ncbi:MAG: alpha/beta fold hydrolase [Deltaproteobacteria bacterium]|nr:alpha/beta fold hydrolase [Deltaproteobacteria bacterium]
MEDGKPFFFEGGKTGVLLIHGFTGTTSSMKPMGEYLAGKGMTVLGPRLPGHGTDVTDMGRYTYNDWIATVETALSELQGMCDTIFVSGLSMGGLLTLYLGENHSNILAGIIPVSAPAHRLIKGGQAAMLPFVPILKHIIKTFKGPGNDLKNPAVTEVAYEKLHMSAMHELIKLIKYVDGNLGHITLPLRIFHAREDHIVPTENAPYIFEHVASKDKKLIWLENSYHVATLDFDKEKIFEESYNFIRSVAG